MPDIVFCSYGCEQEAEFLLWDKKPCCSSNVAKCPIIRQKLADRGSQQVGIKRNWTRSHPWKGKSRTEIFGHEKAHKINNLISKSLTGREFKFISEESREAYSIKARDRIKKRFENGWQPKAGRCRKIPYHSTIAGDIIVDGTWELIVAQYFDHLKLTWSRNKKRFSYINLLQKESFYTPDFYVLEWESYIEVKGFQTELDICKWSQFPHKLLVWRKAEIDRIKEACQSGD